MAAHTKYLSSFKDEFGRSVIIILSQGTPVSEPKLLTCADNPLSIDYTGEEDDAFQSMVSSRATIRISLPEDDIEFYEDMATLQEDQFGVTVVILEGITQVYRWNGWLIPDEQKRTFSYYNQVIELTAIDPISKLKGQKLLNGDDTYINGKQTLAYLVQMCFSRVFNPNNTVGGYSFYIDSPVVLSKDTTTIFPNVFNQLSVAAESFNDDMGRPINCYDVIKAIAESLFMRCFYDNGTIYFLDIDVYGRPTSTAPVSNVYFKGADGYEGNPILLENTENITTVRTFRESRARFDYSGLIGLLNDGYLSEWEIFGGGDRLVKWSYNAAFMAKADKYTRKVGTGRQEAPYGIYLKDDNITGFERIGGKTSTGLSSGAELSVSVKMKIVNAALIPTRDETYDVDIQTGIYVGILVYNTADPTNSAKYVQDSVTREYYWAIIDLSGTSFSSGVIDWSVFDAGLRVYATISADTQVVTADFPKLPDVVGGIAFVSTSSAGSSAIAAVPASANDTIVYNVILSQKTTKLEKETTKGEIVYVTRDISTSKENVERAVILNTSSNFSVAGAYSTPLSYTRFSDGVLVLPGNVPDIAIIGNSFIIKISLIGYAALMRMNYNYSQYKIDFELQGKNVDFYKLISFPCLNDVSRPSSSIFSEKYIQTSNKWEVKSGRRKIIAISMRQNKKLYSGDALNETYDLYEPYYIT